MTGQMKVGTKWIADITNPQAHEIDVAHIAYRLMRDKRFSGNKDALDLWQHSQLVKELAARAGEPERVREWAFHHDFHEGITGDIPTPIKRLLGPAIKDIERAFDKAICAACGIDYPTDETRAIVKKYDAIAAAIEWYYVLGEGDHPDFERPKWCDVPDWVLKHAEK